MQTSNGQIYAIYDNVAQQITGHLIVMRAHAAAIRMFTDVAKDPQTSLSRHTQDYDLVQLGHLTLDNTIVPDYQIILTGKAWQATQQQQPQLVQNGETN